MITELTSGTPKSTGVTVPTVADFVQMTIRKNGRGYLSVINNHATETIFLALGEGTPVAGDYITLEPNGYYEVSNDEFFVGVSGMKLWLKAASAATAIVVH
jgi:hypothetical protein